MLSPWHTARQSTWTAGLRLNVRFASEAADARYGQDYQVLVGGHQPRALGKPVQALLVPTIHATVPRRGMIEVHRVHVKYMIHAATHELCFCWLLDRSELCLWCTGDRL